LGEAPRMAEGVEKLRWLVGGKVGLGLVVSLVRRRVPPTRSCDAVPIWHVL